MPIESHPDPRADGKGEEAIEEQARIERVIAARRERAALRAEYRALAGRVLVIALICWLVLRFGFLPAQNRGQAMAPALQDGDLCVVYRSFARNLLGERLSAGDIVCLRQAGVRRFLRVAAVAGDEVAADESGALRINGAAQGSGARGSAAYPMIIPEGCVFVLGDNRQEAADSRDFGPVPFESVEGKVISILRRRGL